MNALQIVHQQAAAVNMRLTNVEASGILKDIGYPALWKTSNWGEVELRRVLRGYFRKVAP